ncbi:AMP-binding protein, partial [Methanobrevibacter sp.]
MVKQNDGIKFVFDMKSDIDCIDDLINKFKTLNIRFDENLISYSADNHIIYDFEDVSNLNEYDIENIIDSFFCFTFKDIVNVDLYRFLVLKNNDKLTILANIHPLIFDYTSINSFCNLFDNNGDFLQKDLIDYYHNLDMYLNSNDFNKDLGFWEEFISNCGDYVKFYNIVSNDYKCIKIPLSKIEGNKFNFITGVFSLYLSRIDQTNGCILKSSIPKDNDDLDVSTLLKIDYDGDISFGDYLNHVNDVYDSVIQHSRVNIEHYIDFDCFYSVYDFTDLENVEVFNGEGSALTLNIYDDYLALFYNVDLFSDVYMEHMAGNIKSLISVVSDLPDIVCRDIDILSDIEKNLIAEFSNCETVPFDKNTSLGKVFRDNARKFSDKLAIDDGVNQISYGELEFSSNSIANDLLENYGVGLDSVVALILPRDYRFSELVLALNKIGAVFIPVDPSYPIKRIEHMLNIGKADFIIADEDLLDGFVFDVDVIYYDDLNLGYDCELDVVQGSDFAILFTSGTTGLPKGVIHSNKQLLGTAVAFNNIFDSFDCDLVGCYASFSFIASFRIFWALYGGMSCRIFNDDERKDSLKLIELLKDNHFHDVILPPSLGIPILENEDINLDYMVCVGSKLNKFPKSNDFTKIVNAYGMTEIIAI